MTNACTYIPTILRSTYEYIRSARVFKSYEAMEDAWKYNTERRVATPRVASHRVASRQREHDQQNKLLISSFFKSSDLVSASLATRTD